MQGNIGPYDTTKRGDRQYQRYRMLSVVFILICIVSLCVFISSCDSSTSSSPKQTFTTASNQQISYPTGGHDVVIRTFYGGGQKGAFSNAPQISIYGDGTYIFGVNKQGKLTPEQLQKLLNTLVDTYGLLQFQRTQFFDIPDQNAAYLELYFNNKPRELIYGSFGNQQESAQDMAEYHRLQQAFQAITDTLSGPTHPYTSNDTILLAREVYFFDHTQTINEWPITDFTLFQASIYECGTQPDVLNSTNIELGCLKYTVPKNTIWLTQQQQQTLKGVLGNATEGIFQEPYAGVTKYYEVVLRPTLPDEQQNKQVAMFGSAQPGYKPVPILVGTVPPAPTPTPAT